MAKITKSSMKVTNIIKTFEDACGEVGEDYFELMIVLKKLPKDEANYKMLKIIIKSLNEGWTPDWKNESEYKYLPWFDMREKIGSGFFCSVCNQCSRLVCSSPSRLFLKSNELALYAGKQFEQIYYDYMN